MVGGVSTEDRQSSEPFAGMRSSRTSLYVIYVLADSRDRGCSRHRAIGLASMCQGRVLVKAARYVMAAKEQQRKAQSHHDRANPEWRTG